ncbi:hypothetical protein ACQ4PT_032559 [Festuca glaucescens]
MQSSQPCLTADQSSSKRRRIDAADRLGDLPDCLLHGIISCLGSRQAVQTSVLSRRWRHLWRDVPCVAIDEREFTGDNWESFEDFADHMLTSIPLETRLDAFRLHLVTGSLRYSYDNHYNTADRWIRRGLRHFPAAVDIHAAHGITVRWQPYRSDSSVARSQPLLVVGPCDAGFTRRLTTLRLVGVKLTDGFFKDLGGHYPEQLHIERCQIQLFSVVTSPTIRSLVVAEAQRSVPCAHLMIAAPRFAYLRLDIPYDGVDCNCRSGEAVPEPEPLASLAEASIRLTVEMFRRQLGSRQRRKRKIEFLKSMRRFLGLLPNVTKLHLAGFTTAALLDEDFQEFPVIHCLKTLLLENCDVGLKFQALRSILWNTPNLENLGLNHCEFLTTTAKNRRKVGQQPSKGHTSVPQVLWCKNLKSIEIKRLPKDAPHIVKVLSMITEGMQLVCWLQVKISTTVTLARTEVGCYFAEKFSKAAADRDSAEE